MEIAPMNKTNIIEFIIDHLLFKLWNVSSKMRKRLRWMVKERIAVVPTYNKKLLQVFKWIKIEDNCYFTKIRQATYEPKKGIISVGMFSSNILGNISAIDDESEVYEITMPKDKPLKLNYIYKLDMRKIDNPSCLRFYCNKVKKFQLNYLSSQAIQFVLLRVNFIYDLRIFGCKIKSLDLSKIRILKINFCLTDFQGTVKLPYCLQQLNFYYCTGIENTQCSKLQTLSLYLGYNYADIFDCEWFSHMKSLKKLNINKINLKMLNSLSPSIRWIESKEVKEFKIKLDKHKLKQQFPYLHEINLKMNLKHIKFFNLRGVTPIPNKTKAKYSARPKKIIILKGYGELLKSHFELFEQVRDVVVECADFRFDCLPAGIRYLTLNDYNFGDKFFENIRLNRNKFKETILLVNEDKLNTFEPIFDCFKGIETFPKCYTDHVLSAERYPHLKIRQHKI